MAKKKASPAVSVATEAKGQISIITLKGTSGYRDWLAGESRRTHIPAATIVRLGLALWAKESGARTPPEK